MPVLKIEPCQERYPAELVDAFAGKKLVVCGGARSVWDDLLTLNVSGENPNGFDVMTVNDVTMHYDGKITHVYSNDARWLPKWIAARRDLITRKYGGIQYVHSCGTGARYNWPWPGNGSSGLGAVYTGLAMGYSTIVLCGIPLDDAGHYFDPPWKRTNFSREVGNQTNGDLQYWANAKRTVFDVVKPKACVRSQSGRTRELLGAY